jgi:hypothetical protein
MYLPFMYMHCSDMGHGIAHLRAFPREGDAAHKTQESLKCTPFFQNPIPLVFVVSPAGQRNV